MNKFICGTNCDCKDDECNGNPNKLDVIPILWRNKSYLEEVHNNLDLLQDWSIEPIKKAIGKLDKEKGTALRIAVVTINNTVPIVNSIQILGKAEVLHRLKNTFLTTSLHPKND